MNIFVEQMRSRLARRHVCVAQIKYIGKESNALEEVEQGSPAQGSPYTEYPDPSRDGWATIMQRKLKAMPLRELQRLSGLSRQRFRP